MREVICAKKGSCNMRVVDCIQGSPEWWLARRGIPSASEFHRIITPKTRKLAAGHESYAHELIGGLFDPNYGMIEAYQSQAMKHGIMQEPEARRCYQLERSVAVQQVGFCLDDQERFGCSPDALIGDVGLLELKNPAPQTHVAWLLAGVLPDEHKAQVHGQLLVTGRQWADFMSYMPGLPPLLIRVEPDDFTIALANALEIFWTNYQTALAKVRKMP